MPSLGLKAQVGAKAICFTETLDLQQKERRAGSLRLVLWLPCDLGEVISHFWTLIPSLVVSRLGSREAIVCLGGISEKPLGEGMRTYEALTPKPSLGQSSLPLLSSANKPCFKEDVL